jgi:dTDP-4-dehydrorhamnose reductase
MRWLITGAGGMLGTDVVAVLDALAGEDVVAADRTRLDVTDLAAVRAAVAGVDVVINAAAWTDVDGAEAAEDSAYAVNATGAGNLAIAAGDAGARLVHVSTDYVFAGTADAPYAEDAPLAPRSAYGRTKAAGEQAVRALLPERSLIVRTAWVYGAHGGNFVRTMARLAGEREHVDVVDDQTGAPTWSRELAGLLVELVRRGAPAGIYHGTSGGATTWCGLARAVFEELGLDPSRVRPTTTDRFPRPAARPAYSVLGHDALRAAGIEPLGDWREMLHRAAPAVLGTARTAGQASEA